MNKFIKIHIHNFPPAKVALLKQSDSQTAHQFNYYGHSVQFCWTASVLCLHLSLVFDILYSLQWHYTRDVRSIKQLFRHIIFICCFLVAVTMKQTYKQVFHWMKTLQCCQPSDLSVCIVWHLVESIQ